MSDVDLVLGASYVAAVLAQDDVMVDMYRCSNSPEKLLDAVDHYIGVMGRRIAVLQRETPGKFGDALLQAAVVQNSL